MKTLHIEGLSLVAVAAVAATVGLSSCAIPTPETPPAPTLEDRGAVFTVQSEQIVAETFAELAAADLTPDATLFADRIGGDAALVRAAEYTIASKGGDKVTPIPDEILAIYVTSQETWPRIMVAVTKQPETGLTPLVLLWLQDDVQAPYQLRYWSHMLPGAILPAMPGQADGADQLALDAGGLVMTPEVAIDAYVALLTEGAASEHKDEFAEDAYRERMFAARAALDTTAKGRGGTYKDVITARTDEAYVFATGEGGALVFVPFTVTSTFKVPGAQLTLPTKDKALLEGTLTDQVIHHYSDFMVITLPAAGSDVLPALVATDHHLLEVTLKEAT